jgi:signal transduction histidine kinase/CheY-like chemotaxis protein/HPt (histidine-containing phosphotransfer) domain-containing protein
MFSWKLRRYNFLFNYKRNHPLGSRILLWILVCSLSFTLLSTAIQLYYDYRKEMTQIESRLGLIRTGYLDSLAKSLWDLDREQIRVQLEGVLNFPDIRSIRLESSVWDEVITLGTLPENVDFIKTAPRFELIHKTPLKEMQSLGTLYVNIDYDAVYGRLWITGLVTLLSKTLFIFLISIALMVIVQLKVTRYLEAMALYTRQIGRGEEEGPLELNHKTRGARPDELDQVVDAINEMRSAILQDIIRREEAQEQLLYNRDQLQEIVRRRTESLQSAKEVAEAADKAKSQFLATMSHEIRTPLNGVIGMAQLLLESELEERNREYIEGIYQSSTILLDTLNNVLDYAKLVEGVHIPENVPFNLNQLIHSIVLLFTPMATEKSLLLKAHIDPNIHNICDGSVGALRQVLSNLVANALKFTLRGEVNIEVSLVRKNDTEQQLRFAVRDTGIGIPESLQSHIFERFTQADETITRRFGGTGLGLAICKKMVEALDGNIGVTSVEGAGSRFWFELPLSILDDSAIKNESELYLVSRSNFMPNSSQSLRVLLVEDVNINRQVAEAFLSLEGHDVWCAVNGFEALELARNQAFDLILMDVHLPAMSGIEVCRHIRETSSLNQKTPIIALTASVQPKEVEQYFRAGMNSVVPKPLMRGRLNQAISDATQTTEDHSNNQEKNDHSLLLDEALLKLHLDVLGVAKMAQISEEFRYTARVTESEINDAILVSDLFEVSEQAHKLAGAAETIGAQQLAKILKNMEVAANAERVVDVECLHGPFSNTLNQTLLELDVFLEK